MLKRGVVLALLAFLVVPAAGRAALQGQTVLVSAADGSSAPFDDPADGRLPAGDRTMSADGSKVLVVSRFDQGLSVAPRGAHLYVRDAAGHAILVDRATGTTSPAGDADIDPDLQAAISPDGRYVAFISAADNIVPFTHPGPHVYLRDTLAGTTELVDRSSETSFVDDGNGAARPYVSLTVGPDGHVLVVFASAATNLVPNDVNGKDDIFLRDVTAGTTTLVSAQNGSSTTFGDGDSGWPVISGDGRFVAFSSLAKNLTADSVNGFINHVFRRQVRTCSGTTCVPATTTAEIDRIGVNQSDHDAIAGSISDDGTSIAYTSTAANLGNANDVGTDIDVFLWHDTGSSVSIEYASTTPAGESANLDAGEPSVSRDGKVVAFETSATNLVPGLDDFTQHVYARDLGANTLTVLDRSGAGAVGTVNVYGGASLGADGTKAAFTEYPGAGFSAAADGDYLSTYVRDTTAGTTTLMTGLPGGPTGYGDSYPREESVSADGRYVVFTSGADGLTPDGASRQEQVFRRDVLTGHTVLVSRASGPAGAIADDASYAPSISADGQRVAFVSQALNLGGDTSGTTSSELYVRDFTTNTTIAVSRPAGQTTVGEVLTGVAISGDGHHVAFLARGRLVSDADSREHAYEQNIDTGARELVDRGPGAGGAVSTQGAATTVAISDDGSRVAFVSSGPEIDPPVPGFTAHAWVRDLPTETNILADRADGPAGIVADGSVTKVALSGDGTVAAFASSATNLGADSDSGRSDVFVRDLAAGHTTSVAGVDGGASAANPSLDRTGAHLAFTTDAALDPVDANSAVDAYVLDRSTGTEALASRADGPSGAAVSDVDSTNVSDPAVALSASGHCAVFGTDARNVAGPLAPGIPDAMRVYERAVSGDCPVVPPAGGPPPGGKGSPPPPKDTVAPRLSRVSLTRKRFRVGRSATAITARAKAGTILRFTLSETAKVRIAIVRETKTRKRGRHKAKLKLVAAGALSRAGRRGTNLVAFSGRVGRRKLKPGRYRFVLTATDPAGNRSKSVTVRFTVVRR